MNDKIPIKIKYKFINIDKTIDLKWFYYLPFIGWIYPLAFKSKDADAMDHAKQGFVMAAFFTLVLVTLAFSTVFISRSSHVFRLIIAIFIYITELIYYSLCFWGTMLVIKNEKANFPYIKTFADKINI